MGQTTLPPRRPQHAAMRDDGGSYESRERPRSGRGVTSSDRPGSPPHGARHSSDYAARQHHRPRDPAHRHRSRDRSRDYARRDRPASSRPPAEPEDLIPRYRESKARSSEARARTTRGSRSHSRDRGRDRGRDRDRGGLGSPSSSKRHRSRSRSRSRSVSPSHRKRYKTTHSPPPRGPDQTSKPAESKRRRRHSADRRGASPRRHRSSHKSPTRADDGRRRSRRRSPSRSPARSEADRRRSRRDSRHHHKPEAPRSQSRNRSPNRRSFSTRRDSQSRVGEPALAVRTATDDRSRGEGDYRPAAANREPRPPSPQAAQRDRKRGKDFSEPHHASRSDVDDDMTSRSSYRGGGGYPPAHSHQSHHSNDTRGFSQSPQHSGSFHNSPSPSSYGAGRSGWSGGHQQYSPQQ